MSKTGHVYSFAVAVYITLPTSTNDYFQIKEFHIEELVHFVAFLLQLSIQSDGISVTNT
jgi:hypothetical protein